jgi:hypothetical protein
MARTSPVIITFGDHDSGCAGESCASWASFRTSGPSSLPAARRHTPQRWADHVDGIWLRQLPPLFRIRTTRVYKEPLETSWHHPPRQIPGSAPMF